MKGELFACTKLGYGQRTSKVYSKDIASAGEVVCFRCCVTTMSAIYFLNLLRKNERKHGMVRSSVIRVY